MTTQKYLPGTIKGYKATDANICCRDLQYTVGQWMEVPEGDIIECGGNGLHFCTYPSGPWAYYPDVGTRIWECEAEFVLDEPATPGADAKRVCRRLRLTREIIPDGDRNTGDWNTGNCNTGYSNTGDWNTGNCNAGNRNTGDWNTGYSNAGNRNTGNCNTGDWNTGNGNTGNCNTGYSNTGYRNTGYSNAGNRNTGNCNTGDWNTGNGNTGNCNTGVGNATNRSGGVFCQHEPSIICFDVDTGLIWDDFVAKFPNYYRLAELLVQAEPIEFGDFAYLPGITPEKLASLHAKHLAAKA